MKDQSVIHSTFVVERSFPAAPDRVFGAFADPAKKRRWFIEGGGHEVEHYEMDFRVGGKERASLRYREGTPIQGMLCQNETTYQHIVPHRLLVFAYTMTLAERCISASLATVEFLPEETGTRLVLTHQGAYFEGADGPDIRQEGWRKLLERLTEEFQR